MKRMVAVRGTIGRRMLANGKKKVGGKRMEMEEWLNDEFLAQANRMMQKQEAADWCAV